MQAILQILTIVLSGAAVASIVLALYNLVVDQTIKKRLTKIVRQGWAPPDTSLTKTASNISSFVNILSKLSLPAEGWQSSRIQIKFLQAGIRNKNVPQYYFAVKTMLTLVLPVGLALFLHFTQPQIPFLRDLLLVLLTAAAGYYLPEMALSLITKKRIKILRNSLPE